MADAVSPTHRHGRARSALAAMAARAVLAGALTCALAGPAAGTPTPGRVPSEAVSARDEVVPDGVWLAEVALFREHQDTAHDRSNERDPLSDYLLPDRTVQRRTRGAVTRTVNRVDLRLTYGISDTWNLFVEWPYLALEQHSTLEATTADPEVQQAVDNLDDETLSGMGDLRLLSMHRPVFSDRNGFVWGYGLTHPVQERDAGPGPLALALRGPDATLRGFLHYTRYLVSVARARFDFRAEAGTGLGGTARNAAGKKQSFRTGNFGQVNLGYFQEIGPAGLGLEVEQFVRGESRLAGVSQDDPVKETLLRLRLAYGNLRALEEGPLDWPYQAHLLVERTLQGFNVIESDGVTLALRWYF